MKIIAVCGNYRRNGVTERVMEAAVEGARSAGAEVETLTLRDIGFEFCRNCQSCWGGAGGAAIGNCPIRDDLSPWLERIAAADGVILASPVNFSVLTALFKKFQERCLVLSELKPLPAVLRRLTGVPAFPVPRRKGPARPVICITASSAPAWIGRFLYSGAIRQFKAFAEIWTGRIARLIWAPGFTTGASPRIERALDEARRAGAHMAAGR